MFIAVRAVQDKKEDLRSQISAMQTFCLGADVAIDEWISEIGSGLNFKCKHIHANPYTLSKQGLMQAGERGAAEASTRIKLTNTLSNSGMQWTRGGGGSQRPNQMKTTHV